ncbi:MAG TPA: hypothetical protein VEK38_00630 [Candidatus Bathyarchaeia archaeon]|nr:hypothetical protein [Candidatus Bathyarchaeia archaeon]
MKIVHFLYLIILSACFCKNIYADLHITDIKGLYTSIKPEYEYWSPIHGIIAVKTDFLRNLYLMEMQEEKRKKEARETEPSPILNMLRQFFTINPADKTLRITQSKTSIGSYLTPESLADLIDYVMKDEVDKEQQEESDRIFVQSLQEKGVKGRARAVAKAVRECRRVVKGQYYALPYIGQAILVSWLIMKVDTKKKIAAFFDRLVELKSSLIDGSYDRKQFLSESYSEQKKDIAILSQVLQKQVRDKDFLHKHYEDLVFIRFAYPVEEKKEKISLHRFVNYKEKFLVPFESKKRTFADCVEMSLRTFINELLNTGTSFDYHPLKAQGIVLNPAVEKFYDTHHDFKTMHEESVHEAWLNIMSHIKGASIEYEHVHEPTGQACEIRSTVRNVVQTVRYIFSPTPDEILGIQPVPEITTVQYVIDFFSNMLAAIFKNNNKRKIELDSIIIKNSNGMIIEVISADMMRTGEFAQKDQNVDSFYAIILTFVDRKSQEIFDWNIEKGHAIMSAKMSANAELEQLLSYLLLSLYFSKNYNIHDYDFLDIIGIFVFGINNIGTEIEKIIEKNAENFNRLLLLESTLSCVDKIKKVHNIIIQNSHEAIKDLSFLLYFFPPSLIHEIGANTEILSWCEVVSNMIKAKNFSDAIVEAYIKDFILFVTLHIKDKQKFLYCYMGSQNLVKSIRISQRSRINEEKFPELTSLFQQKK